MALRRFWLHAAYGTNYRRRNEPKRVIATALVETGRATEKAAIVAMAREMFDIPLDTPLSLRRVGEGTRDHSLHYAGLCSVHHCDALATETVWLFYVFVHAYTPWQLEHPDDYRLIDMGTAVGVGEKQVMPTFEDDHPVPCPAGCHHPYEDHFVTLTFEVSCRVCGSTCGEVA